MIFFDKFLPIVSLILVKTHNIQRINIPLFTGLRVDEKRRRVRSTCFKQLQWNDVFADVEYGVPSSTI